MEFHFEGIFEQWSKHLIMADRVLVFSPYLTSDTAESLFTQVKAGACEIHTQFTEEVFINKGSSIDTLLTLKEHGIKLFSLPDLHAKLIIVPKVFASIGSQNITNKGRTNLEANVIFSDEKEVDEIYALAKGWLPGRKELTLHELQDMKRLVEPLIDDYEDLVEQANEDIEVLPQNERVKQQFKRALLSLEHSQNSAFGAVRTIHGSYDSERDYCPPDINSFVSKQGSDFTQWQFQGRKQEPLQAKQRYLCWMNDTRKFGWARVGKGRITFIDSYVEGNHDVLLNDYLCSLSFEAVWDEDLLELGEENLLITIQPPLGSRSLLCKANFSPTKVQTGSIEFVDGEFFPDICSTVIKNWINKHRGQFRQALLEKLLESFVAEPALSGVQADQFFGGTDEEYEITLHKMNNYPLLVASPTYGMGRYY